MSKKRKTRELAMQILFFWETAGAADAAAAEQLLRDGTPDDGIRRAARAMASGAWEQRAMIDARLERVAPQWPPRRQPAVDRSILRLAVWELTNVATPPKAVIDEAIELSKEFSTEQSSAFVNGVLDAVLKENQALIAGVQPTTATDATDSDASPAGDQPDAASAIDPQIAPDSTDPKFSRPDTSDLQHAAAAAHPNAASDEDALPQPVESPAQH